MKGTSEHPTGQTNNNIVVRFAGDSGDGIQKIGQQFSISAALCGNDIRTIADFPAEIRAPGGTLAGVSSFQINLAETPIFTPGDDCDVLIAFNPAALTRYLPMVKENGLVILNQDAFHEREWQKAGLKQDPLTALNGQPYRILNLPLNTLTLQATQTCAITPTQARRCKNFFALGLLLWIFDRKLSVIEDWIRDKWQEQPDLLSAISRALLGGYAYAENTELNIKQSALAPAQLIPGLYRAVTGNDAIMYACLAARVLSEKLIFVAGYPITPASGILQSLSQHGNEGVMTFQAEDEIAAIHACIGAAFGGAVAITCTSGPGLDLKTEGLGLAVMAEMPIVIIDVQRAGPSTGMPTKTEQSDLLACVYGRHGESPIPVLAAATPAECFAVMCCALQTAIKHRTPVILLSDTYLAGATEPWLIPEMSKIPRWPAQPQWVVPGVAGGEHIIGGLEKDANTHEVSCDPVNHAQAIQRREEKVQSVQTNYAILETLGNPDSDYCVISWGSTYGTLRTAVEGLVEPIAYVHLRQLWPLPLSLKNIIERYPHILVAELNSGQLATLVQAEYVKKVQRLNKMTGQPFTVRECTDALLDFQHRAMESSGDE